MYEKGMVAVHVCTEFCEEVWHEGGESPNVAFLPHSCDLWEIGGPEEIRLMIADLQVALLRLEPKEP